MTQGSWQFFLMIVCICLLLQGFFAMLEMACVSFNKVRLQYYVSQNNRRAIWLAYLLNHPTKLFGTVLIGVNASLQCGSEASRLFYEALGLDVAFAPLSQVLLVMIFAEIVPITAGRRYAEQVAMVGIPIVYLFSIVLQPAIWIFDLLCRFVNRLVKSRGSGGLDLTREELQKILEEREEDYRVGSKKEEFNTIVTNIFLLKNKRAKDLMEPLERVEMMGVNATVGQMRSLLLSHYSPYLPLYQRTRHNIVAIAYPRDLLRFTDQQLVKDQARSPWFITEEASILQILKTFRTNNQSVAIVLNSAGLAVGVLTLDEVVDELFLPTEGVNESARLSGLPLILVDRTFVGSMKLVDFNYQFHIPLEYENAETLEEVMRELLGHPPEKGEEVRVGNFELRVEEAPLLGEKQISVKTIY